MWLHVGGNRSSVVGLWLQVLACWSVVTVAGLAGGWEGAVKTFRVNHPTVIVTLDVSINPDCLHLQSSAE